MYFVWAAFTQTLISIEFHVSNLRKDLFMHTIRMGSSLLTLGMQLEKLFSKIQRNLDITKDAIDDIFSALLEMLFEKV